MSRNSQKSSTISATVSRTFAICGLLACSAYGHEWASSDGSKRITADFVSLENGNLALSHDGKEFKSNISFFSEKDQQWANAAKEVKEKTKKDQGFLVLLRTEAADCLC